MKYAEPEPETQEVLAKPIFEISKAKKHFEVYISIVDKMFENARNMIINNEATNITATELGTTSMALYKKIIAHKNQVPYYVEAKEYVEAVDSIVTMLAEKLYSTNKKRETIVSITKEKISQYAVVLESQRREQEALEKQARDELQKKLDKKAEETGTIAPKVGGPLISSKRETTVRTETGVAYPSHFWEFEVLDRDLPRKLIKELIALGGKLESSPMFLIAKELDTLMNYLSILYSDTEIRKAIKGGIRDIQGLRIYEKIDTRFRTG